MKNLCLVLWLLLLTILSGCNGSSGANDDGETVTPEATSISLTLVDGQGNTQRSFDKNDNITVIVTVLDQNSLVLADQKVDFVTGLGSLTPTSKLTDNNGQAQVILVNDDRAIGAADISANVGTLSASLSFEFIDNDTPQNQPSLITRLVLDGAVVNQFLADQKVQVTTQLLNSNQAPIVGEIIQFSAEIGQLSAASALTDNQGNATVSLSATEILGAGILTASFFEDGTATLVNQLNYQILPADAVINDADIRIGYFDNNNQFVEGAIELSVDDATLSAGGTLGLAVDLVDSNDQRVTTPTPVTFTSNCVQSEKATIDETVFTINGTAQSTYQDISCANVNGTSDVIVAEITVNGVSKSASEVINISGEQLGSIEFVSAQPSSIVLRGTGGVGKQENSTLTFKVKSALGNPVAQQAVDFSLNTTAGGIELSATSGLTNSQGLVTTQVISGNVPTSVRVTAKATMQTHGEQINVQTQSDLLSINTGLPEQRSITLGASVFNPEAGDHNGEESVITAWLADNFNNPVPDGTTVNFTTEGGQIEPSCTTVNGACSVIWTSAEPRVADHRITILATADGHETFFDTNGSNTFDNNDGIALTNAAASAGWQTLAPQSSGFLDMPEAWRDDNENAFYDVGEQFIDFNDDKTYNAEDGVFNGPQCQGDLCSTTGMDSIHVRKAMTLIMSSSSAIMTLKDSNGNVLADNSGADDESIPIATIAEGDTFAMTLAFSDTALQTLPVGTSVTVSTTSGTISGTRDYRIPNFANVLGQGEVEINFSLTNPIGGGTETITFELEAVTPKDFKSSIIRKIVFQ